MPMTACGVAGGYRHGRPHCERALCCRLAPSCAATLAASNNMFVLHHPSLLGTSIKLDQGAICTDDSNISSGANFSSSPCFVWSHTEVDMECIDGRCGLVAPEAPTAAASHRPSSVCKSALLALWSDVLKRRGRLCCGSQPEALAHRSYRDIKVAASAYQVVTWGLHRCCRCTELTPIRL